MHTVAQTSLSYNPLDIPDEKNNKRPHQEEGLLSGIETQPKKVRFSDPEKSDQINKVDAYAKNNLRINETYSDYIILNDQQQSLVRNYSDTITTLIISELKNSNY